MMNKPKITFVIQTRNRCARLLKTLSLVQARAARMPHEIIVVNTGDSDKTAEALALRFPQVRLIELAADQGAAARNIGLSGARADCVFMLDDGMCPKKDTTEYALGVMAEEPRLAAAVCQIRRVDEPSARTDNGPAGVFGANGVVLRRHAIIEVGGYPIDSSDFGWQYDLCARLWRADWRVCRFESMVAWRGTEADGRDVNVVVKTLMANSLRFWSRYAPEGDYQTILDETIEGYLRAARNASAMAGYREGLAIGLDAIQRNRGRRQPLTQGQLAGLFGPQHIPVRPEKLDVGVPTAA
jgi:glycosyltransferase involved in cell wall biosynthesis